MNSKTVKPIFFNEETTAETSEFYNIPLVGEVHLENEFGSGGNYSLGELIKNFRKKDLRSITLRAMDNGLAGDGIFYGDFLTVDLASKTANGNIAAVKLGHKIYIRKTFFEHNFIRLETTDPGSSPLIVDPKTPGFEIIGRVHTVIREL